MTIRWGILGCGDIARKRVAEAIHADPNSHLLAACRRDKAKLRRFCDQYSVPHAFARAEELIHSEGLDAIYVATPVNQHCRHTCAAAEAGKHVLVEKPMAMSVAECDQMIDRCRRCSVKLGVAYYRRFYPVVCRIQELIESEAIGQSLAALALTGNAFPRQPNDEGSWRVIHAESGGGPIMDIGSHRINLFLDLWGEVKSVRACCSTMSGDFDVEDSAAVLIEFSSGVHASVHCYFGVTDVPDHFSVIGTKGRLVVEPFNKGNLCVEADGQQRTESHPAANNLHGPLIEDFSRSLIEQREPTVTGEEGRAVNEVMERAYQNARVGP